jgi:hypothetical protein
VNLVQFGTPAAGDTIIHDLGIRLTCNGPGDFNFDFVHPARPDTQLVCYYLSQNPGVLVVCIPALETSEDCGKTIADFYLGYFTQATFTFSPIQ